MARNASLAESSAIRFQTAILRSAAAVRLIVRQQGWRRGRPGRSAEERREVDWIIAGYLNPVASRRGQQGHERILCPPLRPKGRLISREFPHLDKCHQGRGVRCLINASLRGYRRQSIMLDRWTGGLFSSRVALCVGEFCSMCSLAINHDK
jgi:hypothetical protein